MDPGAHNFTIWAGATFRETVEWRTSDNVPVDLNLYTGRMEIRNQAKQLLIALSTADGTITAQPDKTALLTIADDLTRAMEPGPYFYDLLFAAQADGVVTALLAGKMTVKPLVTQAEPGP